MVLRYIVYMDSGYQRSCCQYGSLRQENQAGWHHRVPTADEYQAAVRELEERVKHAHGSEEV